MPVSLLALASLAKAGHWSGPVYSGGKFTTESSGTMDFYVNSTTRNYEGGANRTAYGPLKAKFTWVPDGSGDTSTPPGGVYVIETCSATGSSIEGVTGPFALADDGMKDEVNTTTTHVAPSPFCGQLGKRVVDRIEQDSLYARRIR